jgi:solute carrier family 25 (mitochondrial folate transporter), member 32
MSFNRDPTPQPVILAPSPDQYATANREEPSTLHSFNTMPKRSVSPNSALFDRTQIHAAQIPKAWISPICGAGAGFASGIVTCPLDVIKTKLQAQGGFNNRGHRSSISPSKNMYKGIIGTARVIIQEDGLRGMYRGLGPMLMGYLPTWAVYLTVYENTRETYYDMCGSWWVARCYSSLTAGACSTILTNPIWVIKTRLMSQSSKGTADGMRAPFHYTSTFDAARKMYRAEGWRSFYSGLTPAMLGLTHVAIQFPLYEWFKMKFTGYGMGEHPADGHSHFVGISAATFLSKICASTATYPHEVIRTRLQTQQRRWSMASSDGMAVKEKYSGILQTCRIMLAEEGWRAFYAGIGTNLVRAVPAAMTTMLTYEYLQKAFKTMQSEGEKLASKRDGDPS